MTETRPVQKQAFETAHRSDGPDEPFGRRLVDQLDGESGGCTLEAVVAAA